MVQGEHSCGLSGTTTIRQKLEADKSLGHTACGMGCLQRKVTLSHKKMSLYGRMRS